MRLLSAALVECVLIVQHFRLGFPLFNVIIIATMNMLLLLLSCSHFVPPRVYVNKRVMMLSREVTDHSWCHEYMYIHKTLYIVWVQLISDFLNHILYWLCMLNVSLLENRLWTFENACVCVSPQTQTLAIMTREIHKQHRK